jgi:ABC-type transporter Mla subunit MlaD
MWPDPRLCARASAARAVDTVDTVDTDGATADNHRVPKNSRVPSAVGAIPVVGDLMKQADNQAQWMQELIEQNARLVGQFPATMKNFNDTLERFNQTVARLDKVVSTVEAASDRFISPLEDLAPKLERLVSVVDIPSVRDIPDVLDALRKEALPALRAATDTQRQVALLSATVDRVVSILSELPGAGILRRIATGRPDAADV